MVRHALREGQEYKLFTLENFDEEVVDMFSIVIVGILKALLKRKVYYAKGTMFS